MARKGTGGTRLGEPTLTASDWAEAALQLIAEKGLGALTVSALASRLGVTPGAVSQQLAMLRRAGVVDAHRSGRGVYSELTPLGTSLLALLDA